MMEEKDAQIQNLQGIREALEYANLKVRLSHLFCSLIQPCGDFGSVNQLREDLGTAQHHLHQQAGKALFPASSEWNLMSDTKPGDFVRGTGPNDWELQQSMFSEMSGSSKQGLTPMKSTLFVENTSTAQSFDS